jgi:hypothetical protein
MATLNQGTNPIEDRDEVALCQGLSLFVGEGIAWVDLKGWFPLATVACVDDVGPGIVYLDTDAATGVAE